MKARSLGGISVAIIVTFTLAMSASLAWAVAADYSVRDRVPQGVAVVGHDLGGMTEAQAREAIDSAVSVPLMRPVTVTGDRKTWTLDPVGFVSVDVKAMLDEAYATRRSASLVTRLRSALRGMPLPNDVKPRYSVDTTAVAAWVADKATHVDRPSRDATRTIVKYAFKIKPSATGAKVDRNRSTQAVAEALTAEKALSDPERSVALSIVRKKPKVTQSSFKTAIIVSLDRCRIYLYNGAKLVRAYPCAPGMAAYPTPTGDFKVVSKLLYSPWFNPHAAWSANMPDVIPPGPNNPMGVRKIGIDSPGVYMHGVPPGEFGSIGTHASHGCMRMMPSDVRDLFGRVRMGDPVFIRH